MQVYTTPGRHHDVVMEFDPWRCCCRVLVTSSYQWYFDLVPSEGDMVGLCQVVIEVSRLINPVPLFFKVLL